MGNDYTSGYCSQRQGATKMEIDVRKKYTTTNNCPVKFFGGIDEPGNYLIYGVYKSCAGWRPAAWNKNGSNVDDIHALNLKEVPVERTHTVYFTFFSDGTYTSRSEDSYAIPYGCSVVGRETVTFTVPTPGVIKTKVG
jgi:hypothetical protein